MRSLLPLLAVVFAFTLSNCSPTTPQGRIEKHPEIYAELSVEEQKLVSDGKIAEGMAPGGVYLALGQPDRRLEGASEGTQTMRWDYNSLRPIYSSSFYGNYGYGGGYGRRRRGFGFGPTINFIPTRSGTVWFENERVRSYERVRD